MRDKGGRGICCGSQIVKDGLTEATYGMGKGGEGYQDVSAA